MNLSGKTCIPCKLGAAKLSESEINSYKKGLDKEWKVGNMPDKIFREFVFKDFSSAIAFIDKVAKIAEREGHHPNIYLHSYNRVNVKLWTHKIGGLHLNDFILAAKIDKLV